MPPSATALRSFLDGKFPGGEYVACYESGFTGFSTYYSLSASGIECHVVNAADVPTTQYEAVMKTDRVDSLKLARMLASGSYREVYPRPREELDDRAVMRLRYRTQKRIAGMKAAVKHMLHCNGVSVPECFGRRRTYWSRAFTEWLLSVELLSPTNHSVRFAVSQVEAMRRQLLLMTRHIRELSRTPRYSALFEAVYSVPGVGALTAMHLIGEVGCDVARFPNERAFASFLGLVGEEVAGDEDFPLQQGALLADGGGVVEGGRPRRRILRVLRTAKGKHASAEGDNQSGKEIVQQNIQANEIDKNMTCGQCHTGNGCFFRRGRLLCSI